MSDQRTTAVHPIFREVVEAVKSRTGQETIAFSLDPITGWARVRGHHLWLRFAFDTDVAGLIEMRDALDRLISKKAAPE